MNAPADRSELRVMQARYGLETQDEPVVQPRDRLKVNVEHAAFDVAAQLGLQQERALLVADRDSS